MHPDPPDDSDKTVYCQTCHEWVHPRSDCGRDSSHDTAPLPVLRLQNNGPLVPADLTNDGGSLTPEVRRDHAIRKFNPMSNNRGPSGAQTFQSVYYLKGTHTPETVIETWMHANEESLRTAETTKRAVSYGISGEFSDTWDELKADYDWLQTNQPQQAAEHEHSEQTCPNCGETVKNLPIHMRACDG